MGTEAVRFVVDRFEGTVAVLIGDDGEGTEVDRAALPEGVSGGDVLQVPRDHETGFQWREATVDREATEQRRTEAEEVLEDLRKRDPGGDVAL